MGAYPANNEYVYYTRLVLAVCLVLGSET
jgi:hypothetical protein